MHASTKGPGYTLTPRYGDHRLMGDLRFIADLARRMQRSACEPSSGAARSDELTRDRIASGTLDALMWLLDVTDVAPASDGIRLDRSALAVVDEVGLVQRLRRDYQVNGPEWLYFGGAADALDFALGAEEPFWWFPLPDAFRVGPPQRDEYGRAVG